MRSLLGLLLVVGLMFGQGFSFAASICQHHSEREHVAARESHDARIASGALREETAANVGAKKGTAAGAGTIAASLLADLLPRVSLTAADRTADRSLLYVAEQPTLVGRSVHPLLRPPLA